MIARFVARHDIAMLKAAFGCRRPAPSMTGPSCPSRPLIRSALSPIRPGPAFGLCFVGLYDLCVVHWSAPNRLLYGLALRLRTLPETVRVTIWTRFSRLSSPGHQCEACVVALRHAISDHFDYAGIHESASLSSMLTYVQKSPTLAEGIRSWSLRLMGEGKLLARRTTTTGRSPSYQRYTSKATNDANIISPEHHRSGLSSTDS